MNSISPYSPLMVMALFFIGAFFSILLYANGIKTTPTPFDAVQVERKNDKQVLYTFEKQESKTDSPKKVLPLSYAQSLFFNYNSKFVVWMVLFTVLIGVSFASVAPCVQKLIEIKKRLSIPRKIYWKALLSGLGIMALAMLVSNGNIMAYFQSNPVLPLSFVRVMESFEILLHDPISTTQMLMGLSIVGPFCAIMGLFIVMWASHYLREHVAVAKLVNQFQLLTEALLFFLMVSAVIISLTTLTTAFGREAVMQALPIKAPFLFPIEFVYLYGLIFTVFLGVVYIPVYMYLKSKGKELYQIVEMNREQRYAEKTIDSSSMQEGLGNNDSVPYKEVFLLKTSAMDSFKIGLSILGPMLTSLLSKIVEV